MGPCDDVGFAVGCWVGGFVAVGTGVGDDVGNVGVGSGGNVCVGDGVTVGVGIGVGVGAGTDRLLIKESASPCVLEE